MTVKRITLNTEKTTPIYEYPITLRQGDTSIQIPVDLEEDFSEKDLTKTKLEFYSDKPDATTIEDDEQSHFQIGADKKSFTYTFPDELTDASGSTTNTYFKIGNDSTSNFYIHILTKAGMEKLESGDYISKVDRIFNHVMSDYTAINDLAETGKGTFDTALAASKKEMKDLMDNLNAKYVQFINSKTTEFKTFLANLDSQAADVKNKYNALKTQLDALEVPVNAVGTNLYTDTRDFDNPSVWNNWTNWSKTGEKFNGLTVMSTVGDWRGLGQNVQAKKGETYTFSVYARYKSGTGTSTIFFTSPGAATTTPGTVQISLNADWQRVTFTTTVTADGPISARIERTDDNTNTLLIAGPKLEKGSVATDYSLNPLDYWGSGDVQTAITNALSDVKTQIQDSAVGTNLLLKTYAPFSMTGNNISNQWLQMYALSRRLDKGTTVTLSFDVVSTASVKFAIQNNNNGVSDGGTWAYYITDTVGTTKKHYVSTITLDGYAQLGINIKFDNVPSTTTITISNMKLELGSHATDYSLNPSEILTQSDYAKIKAAIVALGGALS